MNSYSSWLYDEFRQIGTDYESDAEIEAYDLRMQKLRDVQNEAKETLCLLDLKPDHTLIGHDIIIVAPINRIPDCPSKDQDQQDAG